MRVARFLWDDGNTEHIARHRVSPDEAEEVFVSRCHIRKTGGGRYLALGRTFAGRYLICVFEVKGGTARVITAREMDGAERRLYRRKI